MSIAPELDREEQAIIAVIARETDTFVRRDFDAWCGCWVQDERVRLVSVSSAFGVTVQEGWPALSHYMRAVFDAGASCEIVSFERRNLSITRRDGIAFVTFDGYSTHTDQRDEHTVEARTLEHTDDGWRIVYASFILRGHQSDHADRVAVDANGNILIATDRARAALSNHPGLQVSNGRLRAKRPSWDKVLQAGLKDAAALHGYCQHYRFATQHGRAFRLPVVLGEDDEGGITVCLLSVRDGVTFVELQSDTDFDHRLAAAKAVFGLSDGQVSLARHVVNGDTLTRAAAELGISVNTARTHLTRMYEKTGVHSQTSLVRTLLCVA
ncbi:MAG: LuxR C-terminal-related transcriptional regulator [Pseudomonadota bacterium]